MRPPSDPASHRRPDLGVRATGIMALCSCITRIPRKEFLIVLGDFNAKIGDTSMDTSLRNIVGNYGLGIRNDRGDCLLQFATDNGMTIMNTVFKQHPRRLYTWTPSDGEHQNQIDYIMIKER